jgi:Uma2 family endonuclease
MIRTQVQLTAEQARALKDLAHQEDASIAELVRRAIDYWLEAAVTAAAGAAARQRALAMALRAPADQPAVSDQRVEYQVEIARPPGRWSGVEPAAAPPPRVPAHLAWPTLPPPLEPGDRLTAAEFERRYEAMPHLKKAELIEGVVYMPSPVRVNHAVSHGAVIAWLAAYAAATPGVQLADNATLRLDLKNVVQLDALLRLEPAQGGRSRVTADDYYAGAPELVVEVATSSAAYDLFEKRQVYRHHGVQEYVVWQVLDDRLDWWQLVGEEYVALAAGADGLMRSQVFPGLWLAPQAIRVGNLRAVLDRLQEGLASSEHGQFVGRLAAGATH